MSVALYILLAVAGLDALLLVLVLLRWAQWALRNRREKAAGPAVYRALDP